MYGEKFAEKRVKSQVVSIIYAAFEREGLENIFDYILAVQLDFTVSKHTTS